MKEFKDILPESQACQVLTCLPEKFIVDFANGIDVARDHIRSQKERSFFTRIKEGMSGKSSARQAAINATLTDGVEASLTWLTELTSSLATTNYALAQVNDRLTSLITDTTSIVNYSVETRKQLKIIAESVHIRLSNMEQKLNNIDRLQRGKLHLDTILSGWSAGRFNSLSLAGRCYVVLEELYWGSFGDVIREGKVNEVKDMLDLLKNRSIVQLSIDCKSDATTRHDTNIWLSQQGRSTSNDDWIDAIDWLGDWSDADRYPIVYSTTQQYTNLPLCMPRLSSAQRIADSMVDEVFSRCRND
ncbi:diguanylate cyclase regulator RdcB family protein [Providencia sp. PROV033]|uniref:diguanylate cyclase regulator RdcB family protein n=1 Tax=Providencia sp. PROV033 TaxID=2949765 RepID=UPI00234AF6F9|nr:diguanylate cyclase regulator RdcB family protein [Providencia sp. PROV033]